MRDIYCTCDIRTSIIVRPLFLLLDQADLGHKEAVLTGQRAHVVDDVILVELHEGGSRQRPFLCWEGKRRREESSFQHCTLH